MECIVIKRKVCMHVQSAVFGFPKAVNPTAYAAMYDIMLNSKTTGGLSASKSQGFHLEAELMLMGGGAGDSDCSLHEPRDLGQVNIDNTHTVAGKSLISLLIAACVCVFTFLFRTRLG